jgi:hypothetical protein
MSLYLITDEERPNWKALVEMSDAEAEQIGEGGYTAELLDPISFADFIVGHSPLTDRVPSSLRRS